MTQRKPPRIYSEPVGCMSGIGMVPFIIAGSLFAAAVLLLITLVAPWLVFIGAAAALWWVWGKPLLGWLFGTPGRR